MTEILESTHIENWKILTEDECIQHLANGLVAMKKSHEAGHTCFCQSGNWRQTEYGWHNPLFPPEYRRSCLKGSNFEINASSELYFFMAVCYEQMTGGRAPGNFELDVSWKERMKKRMQGWSTEHQNAMLHVISVCTRWHPEKRMPDAVRLFQTSDMRCLYRFAMRCR